MDGPTRVPGFAQRQPNDGSTSSFEFLATGLGFALAHVEQSFDKLFDLEGEPDSYVEFSTEALLRSDPKDRIEMLARGVQSGIYSPNEARASEDLDAVPFGDEPRVESQVVPLSAASAIPAAPAAAASPASPAATANYHTTVQRDVAALRACGRRRDQVANGHLKHGAAEQRGAIFRKVSNGAQRRP
jgi:hypothetical protein